MKYNGLRAKQAIILIIIVFAVELIMFFFNCSDYYSFTHDVAGENTHSRALSKIEVRNLLLSIFYTIVMIVSGIFYIRWFRRAYFNLHTKVKYLNYSEGWAAGAWLVPFINLFRPYYIMQELYRETHRLLHSNKMDYSKALNLTPVRIWWFLWVSRSFFRRITDYFAEGGPRIKEMLFAAKMSTFSILWTIPLAILAIKVIKDYAEMEVHFLKLDNTPTSSQR